MDTGLLAFPQKETERLIGGHYGFFMFLPKLSKAEGWGSKLSPMVYASAVMDFSESWPLAAFYIGQESRYHSV